MSPAYHSGASRFFPLAQIVFDRFHLLQMLSKLSISSISPNPNAPPIPFVDGRCIVDIPQSGLLLVRDMEPFRRFHSGAARYTSGALLPVAVSASTSEDIQLFYLSTDSDGNSWWLVGPGAREHACLTMRLEILTPRHWTHPSKNFLRQWLLQDWVRAQNHRTVRINVPRVSA